METLAKRLSRSPRTIQRHLHLLREKGLVEFVERKRDRGGRFGAYLYRVLHILSSSSKTHTTGHKNRVVPIKRNKRQEDTPLPPKKDPKEGYSWLFGDPAPSEHDRKVNEKRKVGAERRREGYEWLFK